MARLLAALCVVLFASTPALAQTPDAIRTALSKVEAAGKGPCSDTVFLKNIPLIGKSPMPGSAWRPIRNGLPKPRTKAVVDATMAQLGVPLASAPVMQPVSDPPPVALPVVVSAPRVVVAQDPAPVVVVQPVAAPVSDAVMALRNGGLYPGTKLDAQIADKDYSLTLSGGEERYEIRAGDRWQNDGKGTVRRRSETSGLTGPATALWCSATT